MWETDDPRGTIDMLEKIIAGLKVLIVLERKGPNGPALQQLRFQVVRPSAETIAHIRRYRTCIGHGEVADHL